MSQYSILKNEWLKWIDGGNNEQGNYNHVDKDGNIYMCGFSTSSSVSINNPNGTLITYTGPNVAGTFGDYLVKFNPSGTVLWFKWINGGGNDQSFKTITTDTNGDVYYSGYTTSSSITIANTLGTLNTFTNSLAGATQDIFIMKLSSDGNTVSWVKWLTSSGSDFGLFLKIDSLNNLYLCGFSNTTQITYNGITYTGGTSASTNSGFLLKIDTSVSGAGAALWFKWIIGTTNSNINVYALDTDATDNVIIGYWALAENLTIGGTGYSSVGPITTALRAETTFITKFNSAGVVQWTKSIDGNLGDFTFALVVMTNGNICIAGSTLSTSLLINGTNFSARPTASGYAMYVCILDSSGIPLPSNQFIWIDSLDALNSDKGFSIKCDSRNNLYLSGTYTSSLTINGTAYTKTGTDIDGFILKLNSSLVSQWFYPIIGSIGSANEFAGGLSLSRNSDSPDIYITGYNTVGSISLQGSAYTRTLTGEAAFLFKLTQFEPIVLQYSNIVSGDTIMLPIKSITGNIQINWGDGSSIETISANNPTHNYTLSRPGSNSTTIQIYSTNPTATNYFTQFGINLVSDVVDNIGKLTNLQQFGSFPLTSLKGAFLNATSLSTINTSFNTNPSTVTNMSYMFYGATNFNQSVSFLTTTNVTDMSYMFYGCSIFNGTITSLNTAAVTNMSNMFYNCVAFNQAINTSGNIWNTALVNNMSYMFYGCSIFNGNITSWNTAAVTNMSYMFYNCVAFNQAINTSSSIWNTALVNNMSYMFYGCSIFNGTITSWNTAAVTNMSNMFYNCVAFNQAINTSVNIWNTALVNNMSYMFYGCTLFNGTITSWNTAAVTNMSYMFYNCLAFNKNINTSVNIWNTALVNNMSYMFYGCLVFNGTITSWNTAAVTNMSNMFNTAKAFNQGINGWNVALVTNMSYMFATAEAFNQFIGSWNVSAVTDMSYMFNGAKIYNQSFGSITPWNTANVITMSNMFNGAIAFNSSINNLNISKVNDFSSMFQGASSYNQNLNSWSILSSVGSVVNMSSMFQNAISFNSNITTWNTSKVNNMSSMFSGAVAFNQAIDTLGSNWIVSSVINMSYMFNGASNFNKNLNNWNVSAVTNMSYMFNGASVFNGDISNWTTNNVTNMTAMFNSANAFNKSLTTSSNIWNVSAVTNMSYMFFSASLFNQDLNTWDVSSVTDMSNMFYGASVFNGDITTWNTINVLNMSYMFYIAVAFNKNISNWNTAKVTNMQNMFNASVAFNQYLNNWNVSLVINMSSMFYGATSFNQPLNNWNVSATTNMSSMFNSAIAFNQNLSSWNVANVTNMTTMFTTSGLSNINYTYTLIGWSALPSLQSAVSLGATSKQYYTDAVSARSYLTTTKSWLITDGGALTVSINPRYGSPFRYYKWLITKTRSLTTGVQASEFVFYDYYNVPIPLTTFTITNPSGVNPIGNEPSKLIDNNFFSMWVDTNGVSSTLQLDLGVNYITVQKPYSYSFITGIDDITRDPSSWKLYGSHNSTIWFLLNEQTDYIATTTRNTEATSSVNGQNYFTISYPTTSPFQLQYTATPTSLTITLPLSGTVNVAVNWGDTKYNAYTTSGEKTHTYSTSGPYTVEIDGTLTQFGLGDSTYLYAPLLSNVISFGEIGLTSLSGAFNGATNLLLVPASLPIKSSITDLSYTFKGAINFGGSLANDNITKWNVASVSNMAYLFSGCIAFNKDVSKWFLYKVTSMSHMFSGCSNFNKNISNWNVSSATDMSYILADCSSFNQDLSNWNISNVTNMDHFFHQTPISKTNYDNMLIAWSNSNPQNTVSTFYADLTKYSYGNPSLARYKLSVSPYQWSITDLGIDTTTLPTPMSLEYRVTTGNLTITLPLYGIVDVLLSWGDTSSLFTYTTTGDKTHTYSTIGTYTVLIYNRLTQFGNGSTSYANADRLYKVNSFGDISLTSLSGAFYGATNLTEVPTSLPTSSTITDLSYAFKNATSFDQDISNWDISSITTMENMFDGVTLSTTNYDLLLNAWVLLSLQKNVLFNAGSSKYSYGFPTISRNKITNVNNYNWTIIDGGQDPTTIPASAMVLVYTVSSSKTITLPLNTLNNYPINISVDWGDSITDTYTTIGNKTHTYSTAGDYLVKITGTLIQFGNGATGYTNPEKLVRVLSFGNIGITSLSGAFYGCSNLIEIPSSISFSITNLDYAFYNCLTLNDINITYWDMTNVINIDYMLYNAQSFDQNIFTWTVTNLTHFRFLLYQATAFKQPISGWLLTYLNLFPLTPT